MFLTGVRPKPAVVVGTLRPVNKAHLQFLASPEWAQMLETDLVPWLDRAGDLGDDVLEIGPGPGLTTDLLRARVARVTAVELDEALASALAARLASTNVSVIQADATATDLEPGTFSSVVCFSMLHHMPSSDLQDRLFAEAHRVLRPGGRLLAIERRTRPGAKGLASHGWTDDQAAAFADLCRTAGFTDVQVETHAPGRHALLVVRARR